MDKIGLLLLFAKIMSVPVEGYCPTSSFIDGNRIWVNGLEKIVWKLHMHILGLNLPLFSK